MRNVELIKGMFGALFLIVFALAPAQATVILDYTGDMDDPDTAYAYPTNFDTGGTWTFVYWGEHDYVNLEVSDTFGNSPFPGSGTLDRVLNCWDNWDTHPSIYGLPRLEKNVDPILYGTGSEPLVYASVDFCVYETFDDTSDLGWQFELYNTQRLPLAGVIMGEDVGDGFGPEIRVLGGNVSRRLGTGVSLDTGVWYRAELMCDLTAKTFDLTLTRDGGVPQTFNAITMEHANIWFYDIAYLRLAARHQKWTNDYTLVDSIKLGTTVAIADTDTDNDGMADDWEMAQWGDLSHDGVSDDDGDGATNYDEYVADTNPTAGVGALYYFGIYKIEKDGSGNITLHMRDTSVNRKYAIYYSDTGPGSWTPVPNQGARTGTGGGDQWIDDGSDIGLSPATAGKRYYKVEVSVP